jgi:single-strand DNA-binding protein
MSLNQCNFIGNLGRDPEIRSFQSGEKVANLRLAVSEKWKDKQTGERKERTEWVSVAVFGPLAGIAEQYLRKGSKVFVSGKLVTRKYQDQSGADRYSTEVVLQGPQAILTMLDGPSQRDDGQSSDTGSGYGGGYGAPATGGAGGIGDMDDEIPFAPWVL